MKAVGGWWAARNVLAQIWLARAHGSRCSWGPGEPADPVGGFARLRHKLSKTQYLEFLFPLVPTHWENHRGRVDALKYLIDKYISFS
jgi:hypothetical protein